MKEICSIHYLISLKGDTKQLISQQERQKKSRSYKVADTLKVEAGIA
jgi:hypothetical protein